MTYCWKGTCLRLFYSHFYESIRLWSFLHKVFGEEYICFVTQLNFYHSSICWTPTDIAILWCLHTCFFVTEYAPFYLSTFQRVIMFIAELKNFSTWNTFSLGETTWKLMLEIYTKQSKYICHECLALINRYECSIIDTPGVSFPNS